MRWGRTAVAGLRVELWQRYDGGVVLSTSTGADGRFVLQPAQAVQADWYIAWPAQSGYIAQSVPLFLAPDPAAQCATQTFEPQLQRAIATVSIAGTSSCGYDPRCDVRTFPMVVGWSAMAGASYYCIEVLNNDTGQFILTGPVCDGSPSYMYSGPATTYAVTTLRPGGYQFIVIAVLAGNGTYAAPFDGIALGSGSVYFRVN